MSRLPALPLAVLAFACGGSTPADTKTEAKPDAKPAAEPTAKVETKSDTKAAMTPTETITADEWLVWTGKANAYTTRWVVADDAAPKILAEHAGLVVAVGDALWEIERNDGTAVVKNCACLEDPPAPGCKTIGKLVRPGLRMREIGGARTVELDPPSNGEDMAEDASTSLDILGGAGDLLFYAIGTSGYFCGAHGMTEISHRVVDLSAPGKDMLEIKTAVGKALPEGLRRDAAEQIRTALQGCDEDPSVEEIVGERMGLSGFSLGLSAGTPSIGWFFTADAPYFCAPDYAAHGDVHSSLVTEAAPLGLGGPLPSALTKVLADLGTADDLGWSKVSGDPSARATRRAAFAALPAGAPWPAAESSIQADAGMPEDDPLETARKLTRDKDYDGAIAAFDAIIATDPKQAKALSGRGYAHLLAGHLDEADRDFVYALALDDTPAFVAAVTYNRGLVAERKGDDKAAAKHYEASLALRDATAVREALARVTKKPGG